MNRREFGIGVVGAALAGPALLRQAAAQEAPKRVIIVSQAAGFRHSSIPTAAATVTRLGEETKRWTVTKNLGTPEEVAAGITAEGLKEADLVFFANTTGNLAITDAGKDAFYAWIEGGGAWAGVHSASDTFHGDERFLRVCGGEFQTHGRQVEVEVRADDREHPATRDLPESFRIYDEIYEFKNWDRAKVHMLLSMPRHPQRMDEAGDFPVAWCQRIGMGRSFYTSLGHRENVYEIDLYRKHLTGGLLWALGLERGRARPGNPQNTG